MDKELPSDLYCDHIDWINVWKERKLRQLSTPHYSKSIDFWSDEENVRRLYLYDKKGRANLVMEQLGGIKVYPGAKVLDIGAGPGTLAVPLARRGCKVTVVEPSPVMVSALRDYQASEKVEEIHIIEKRWEDVTVEELGGPFDIVIASYSLSMVDIDEAVRKMDAVCSGTAYLFWFLKPSPSSEVLFDLWPKVHGVPYYYEPKADCLLMALLQMGIYPNFEVLKSNHRHRYLTIGDATADFHRRMACTDEHQDKIIRNYLRTKLTMIGNEFQLRGSSYGAKIWWTKAHDSTQRP
ncbi:MAG: class I SAM-dependent methyltransferase [Methanomicrobiales archaeon]